MIVLPDDEIYRVDEVFLGPEKFRFPWRWTYRQYGVAVVTFLALQGIERQVGIPVGVWPMLFAGLITVWVTRWVHEGINWDRGLKVAAQEAHLEMIGPREDTKTVRAALTVARSRRARKRREKVIADTYGPDDDLASNDDRTMPSWWSQFKPTKDKPTKKREQKRSTMVDDRSEASGDHSGHQGKVPEYGGHR